MKERFIGPIAVILLWQIVALTGMVSDLILPAPAAVASALFKDVATGLLLRDLGFSLFRLTIGFSLGSILGVIIGTLFGVSSRAYALSELVIDFFRSLPVITLFPLSMIIFGLGDASKIALTTWTVFLVAIVNTVYGVRQVPSARVLASRSLGAKGFAIVRKVIIPSAAPTIVAGLRLSISLGLIVVVVTEMFTGTQYGLGKRIYDSGLVYQIPGMYAAILVTGLAGYLLNKLIVYAESRVIHWAGI
jgi:NitT/TauT family transport system permease protein